MSVRSETYTIDTSDVDVIRVAYTSTRATASGPVDLNGQVCFERANLEPLVRALRACLQTYAFPKTVIASGQDRLVVFDSGPEQAPHVNIHNDRPKQARFAGSYSIGMSKPLAQNLLDDLARLLQNSSP